jgi:hypothetical protein
MCLKIDGQRGKMSLAAGLEIWEVCVNKGDDLHNHHG